MEDKQQFILIYDEYSEKIFRYIHYKTCNRETAEDITSLTFLKAMEKWCQFDQSKGTVSSWLYGIARNLVTDHYRMRGKWGFVGDISDVWGLASNDDILKELMESETRTELRKALGILNAKQREVIMLRLWDDLPYKEIAPILGKSEDNCKMLFSRALKKLKTRLGAAVLYQIVLCRFDFSKGVNNE